MTFEKKPRMNNPKSLPNPKRLDMQESVSFRSVKMFPRPITA